MKQWYLQNITHIYRYTQHMNVTLTWKWEEGDEPKKINNIFFYNKSYKYNEWSYISPQNQRSLAHKRKQYIILF